LILNGRGFFDEFDGVKTVKLNPFWSSMPVAAPVDARRVFATF
jgi:hypothetical protein